VRWILFIVVTVVCALSVLVNFVLSAGLTGGGVRAEKVNERHLFGPSGMSASAKVAVVTVDDIITGTEETGATAWIFQQLKRAEDDGKVKAIILDVNSPGGGITASDIVHERVKKFQKRGKKVIVLMRDVAASGAYYISASADEIVAHPTTITGSIGVIVSSFNIEGLFGKIGVEAVVFKSAPYKDLLSPYRPVTPEESAILQGIVDKMFARFKEIVAEGRSLTEDEVDAVSNGAIFTAQEALDRKLIDSIGYFDDAVTSARKAAGTTNIEVVRYEKPPTLMDVLFSSKTDAAGDLTEEMAKLVETRRPGFYYLWPGP